MHHAPFNHTPLLLLLDSQYRLYTLSVLSFFIHHWHCHYFCHRHCQGLPLPCTTNVISCQYLTLDRVGIEPTTFQSADHASNHYTTGALMEMMVALRNITLIFKTEEPTGMKYLLETQKIKNMFIPVVSDLIGHQISQNFSTSYFVGSLKTLRSFDNLKD